MQMQPSSSHRHSPQSFLQRVDRILGEINALLVAIAIGLAALDLTCFIGFSTLSALHRAPQWAQTLGDTHADLQPPLGGGFMR